MLNQIDQIVILTLDKRYDLAQELVAQYNRILLPYTNKSAELFVVGDGKHDVKYDLVDSDELPPRLPHSTTYPTWWKHPNAFNAFKSHTAIFKRFLETGGRRLLLMEDDAYIWDDAADIYNQNADFLYNMSDITYLGGYNRRGTYTKINNSLIKCHGTAGFHGIILRDFSIKELLKCGPRGPYDESCHLYVQKSQNAYQIYPSVITQRPGISYVEGGNYLPKPDRYSLEN